MRSLRNRNSNQSWQADDVVDARDLLAPSFPLNAFCSHRFPLIRDSAHNISRLACRPCQTGPRPAMRHMTVSHLCSRDILSSSSCARFITSGNYDRQLWLHPYFWRLREFIMLPKLYCLSECWAPLGYVLQPYNIWGLSSVSGPGMILLSPPSTLTSG